MKQLKKKKEKKIGHKERKAFIFILCKSQTKLASEDLLIYLFLLGCISFIAITILFEPGVKFYFSYHYRSVKLYSYS